MIVREIIEVIKYLNPPVDFKYLSKAKQVAILEIEGRFQNGNLSYNDSTKEMSHAMVRFVELMGQYFEKIDVHEALEAERNKPLCLTCSYYNHTIHMSKKKTIECRLPNSKVKITDAKGDLDGAGFCVSYQDLDLAIK